MFHINILLFTFLCKIRLNVDYSLKYVFLKNVDNILL